MKRQIERVLSVYRNHPDAGPWTREELELRFRDVDLEMFVSALEKLSGFRSGAKFSGIVRLVRFLQGANSFTRHITQYGTGNGIDPNETCYIKRQISTALIDSDQWHRNHPFRISYSHETVTLPDSFNDSRDYRILLRTSFIYPAASADWRIDLSLVRQGNWQDGEQAWRSAYKQLFESADLHKPDLILKWLASLNDGLRQTLKPEIEAEYVGASGLAAESMIIGASDRSLGGVVGYLTQAFDAEVHDRTTYRTLMHDIARLLGKDTKTARGMNRALTTRTLAPAVRNLSWAEYKKIHPPIDYHVAEKSDGVRAFACIKHKRGFILTDKLEYRTYIADVPHRGEKGFFSYYSLPTLVDGELLDDGRFLIIDVVLLENVRVFETEFEKRLSCFDEAARVLRRSGINAYAKKFHKLTSTAPDFLTDTLTTIQNDRARDYPTDGLIFVGPGQNYLTTTTYKWKPLQHQTIDFLCKKVPQGLFETLSNTHRRGMELHFLFVGADSKMAQCLRLPHCPGYETLFAEKNRSPGYYPVAFSPSDTPKAYHYWHRADEDIDGKIIELKADPDEPVDASGYVNWVFLQQREDRSGDVLTDGYVGNNIAVAEQTWRNYQDPILLRHICNNDKSEYFLGEKSDEYAAQARLISELKERSIANFVNGADWAVDLAAGRGQDLGRYFRCGLRNLVAVDCDQSALSELVSRKFQLGRHSDYSGTRCFVIAADLQRHQDETLSRIKALPDYPESGCNAVVCNLAIHYFAQNPQSLEGFAELCRALLRPDGHVILTVLRGELVHAKLKQNLIGFGQKWNLTANGSIKNSIVRLYREEELAPVGQEIAALHPFSNGQYYREFLINTEFLEAVFRSRSLYLVKVDMVETPREIEIAKCDLDYAGLYGSYVFKYR